MAYQYVPVDCEGSKLKIGDAVVFNPSLHFMARGVIVAFERIGKLEQGLALVVAAPNKDYVHRVLCDVTFKLSS